MVVTPAMLRQLHRIHRQISDLKGRMEQGPRRVARSQAVCTRHEQQVAEAQENFQKARKSVNEKQAQLQQREARILQLKGRLPACTSNKEYQALDEQIAADEQANSVLADEILELLEKLDELQGEVDQYENLLQQARAELQKVQDQVAGQRQELGAELARVQGNLKEAESVLPADFLQDYKRISDVRGEDALAQVEGNSCGGCFQTLTAQMLNMLNMGRLVVCGSCGCILYMAEESGPQSSDHP